MTNTHYLRQETHSDFLAQQRIDPITGEKIEEGHTVVICAACKSAFFIESWEYLGGSHCNQENTLEQIPVRKSLQLIAKPLEYLPFLFRKGSYYPWNKKEADRGYYQLVLSAVIGTITGLFLVFLSIVWLKSAFLFVLEMIALSIIAWAISLIFKRNQKKRAFRKKQSITKSTYFAFDAQTQSISYKKGIKTNSIDLSQLSQLNYKLNFMPFKECAKHNQFILSLELITNENKKIRYYTVFHEEQIAHWSKFLAELPYHLPVLHLK